GATGRDPTLSTDQAMQLVFGHVRTGRGNLHHLVAPRLGISALQLAPTPPPDLRFALDPLGALLHRQHGALVWGLARLPPAAAPSSCRRLTYRSAQFDSSSRGERIPQHLTPSTQAEAEAEACFLKAIDIARRQQAKSLELRAVMSLSRLWQSQGKQKEAHEL